MCLVNLLAFLIIYLLCFLKIHLSFVPFKNSSSLCYFAVWTLSQMNICDRLVNQFYIFLTEYLFN